MFKSLPIFLIATIISLVSCEKETSVENGFTNNTDSTIVVNNDSTLITKLVLFDVTQNLNSTDTDYIIKWQYDNLNRIIRTSKLYYQDINGVFTNSPTDSSYYIMSYIGNDTLPSRIVKKEPDILADTLYSIFQQGRCVYDSFVYGDPIGFNQRFISVANYQFMTNKVSTSYKSYVNDSLLPNYTSFYDYYLNRLNGNLVSQIDTIPNQAIYQVTTIQHDNKPNPFNKGFDYLDGKFNDQYYPNDLTLPYCFFEKNNPVLIKQVDNVGFNNTTQISYQYKNNGLPAIFLSEVIIGNNIGTKTKGIFFYKKRL